jgi:hypothetical protein
MESVQAATVVGARNDIVTDLSVRDIRQCANVLAAINLAQDIPQLAPLVFMHFPGSASDLADDPVNLHSGPAHPDCFIMKLRR